jgi:two-component system, chemotaxis family, response regulator Rcp1
MKSINILLVEDNEGDILLTTEALEEIKLINKIDVVKNGRDALEFLYKRGNFTTATTPDLIILDINLPLKSGHEVLQIIKNDDVLKQIPVIMLTTSSAEKDITTAYKFHANCYITKPVEVNQFLSAVLGIQNFWINIVALPNVKN